MQRHEAGTNAFSRWSSQSLVAHSCRLLNHLNSFCRGTFELNAKFDADLLLCSLILNVMSKRYTGSFNTVSCPHWLVQWSCHCSHIRIPVHSSWLPGYIDVVQTVLVILTMVGLFPDTPCMVWSDLWFKKVILAIMFGVCEGLTEIREASLEPPAFIYKGRWGGLIQVYF